MTRFIQSLGRGEAGITSTDINQNLTTVPVYAAADNFLPCQISFDHFTQKAADADTVQRITDAQQFAFEAIDQMQQRFTRGSASPAAVLHSSAA